MYANLKTSVSVRALALCVVSGFFLMPVGLQAGEGQKKYKTDMEKSQYEMEKAAEEIQAVDPAAGPVDEGTSQEFYEEDGILMAPETKAIYKRPAAEKVTDQEQPE